MRHDNDVIDVKTFWCPFCCFVASENRNCTQKLVVFQGNSCSYRTRIIVNACYWNTCKLVFTMTHTHWYPDSYSYQCERGLRVVKIWIGLWLVWCSHRKNETKQLPAVNKPTDQSLTSLAGLPALCKYWGHYVESSGDLLACCWLLFNC